MRSITILPSPRDGWAELEFRWDAELVGVVRALRERRWDSRRRRWQLPLAQLEPLLTELRQRSVQTTIEPGIRSVAVAAVRTPDATNEGATRLVERADAELRLRRYSVRTRRAYLKIIRRFAVDAAGREIIVELVRDYLLSLVNGGISVGYHGQCVAALRFLCEHVLRAPLAAGAIPTPRRGRSLPTVLGIPEVRRLFAELRNTGHRLMALLLYSAGLRVSELVRLQLRDVDQDRRLIHVRRGKGHKDRYTLYSPQIADDLDLHLALRRRRIGAASARDDGAAFLFVGRDGNGAITARTVQHIIAAAAKRAGLMKRVTPHTLRHSFATHLLEQGVDLRYIQEVLGHASSRTTETCTHVTERSLARLRSPLDMMDPS